MPRERRPTLRGRLAVLACLALLVAGCREAARDEAGAISEGGRVSAMELRVGDCFDDPTSSAIVTVTAIPCDEPHDNEVFALPHHPGGPDDPYPGDDALFSYADRTCLEAFADYVGLAYPDSIFPLAYYIPGDDTWVDGDREIVCFLYHPDLEKLEGSMRGAGR